VGVQNPILHKTDDSVCKELCSLLPSSSRDVAVATSAQAIAIALSQEHGFIRVVAAKQMPEPGDAERPKGTQATALNSSVVSG
jgi:hypothetical protein